MSVQIKYGLLLLILALIPTFAHSFYKCVDEKGNTTYQKTACPSDSSQTETRSHSPTTPNEKPAKHEEFISDKPMKRSDALFARRRLTNAISSLSPIKMHIVEHHATGGNWPKTLADIGLANDKMNSSIIDSIRLGANGDFAAKLNSTFGEDKLIVFKPKITLGGTNTEWDCYANFTKEVLSFNNFTICESSANPELTTVASSPLPRSNLSSNSSSKNDEDFLRPGERRMLEKYDERGRRLREAKKESLKKYQNEKKEKEYKTAEERIEERRKEIKREKKRKKGSAGNNILDKELCSYHKDAIKTLNEKLLRGYQSGSNISITEEILMHKKYVDNNCDY